MLGSQGRYLNQIIVENQNKHRVNDKLDLEESFCIGVPFVVDDNLNSLLLKQGKILTVHQCFDQIYFILKS